MEKNNLELVSREMYSEMSSMDSVNTTEENFTIKKEKDVKI